MKVKTTTLEWILEHRGTSSTVFWKRKWSEFNTIMAGRLKHPSEHMLMNRSGLVGAGEEVGVLREPNNPYDRQELPHSQLTTRVDRILS